MYRLNLEQGRFLNSFTTKARYGVCVCVCVCDPCISCILQAFPVNKFNYCSGCNVCQLNSEHQLFTVGTEEVGGVTDSILAGMS